MSNNNSVRAKLPNKSFGTAFVWLVAGGYYLGFSFEISEPLTLAKYDPGPAFLPKVLGLALLGGGVFSIVRTLNAQPMPTNKSVRYGSSRIAASVLGFILLMPVLGFHLSCSIFGITSMLIMRVPWWKACLSTTVIVAAIHFVFIELFMISLPSITIQMSLF